MARACLAERPLRRTGFEMSALVKAFRSEAAPPMPECGGIFRDGDRWMAVGDSITQNGAYSLWIFLFYLTRLPHWSFDLFNAGISGDSAEGALRRFDWDIRGFDATVATIMFGMNDVSRELYDNGSRIAGAALLREQRLEEFRTNLTTLARRLKDDGVRVALVTPSIYGRATPGLDGEGETGVNGALARCVGIMRSLAESLSADFIDLFHPMMEVDRRLRELAPHSGLLSPDRVHPTAMGNFVMAYLFLKGSRAPAAVSEVDLDAERLRVRRAENAVIGEFVLGSHGPAFSVRAAALPFPVDGEVETALHGIPFHDDLNREMLRVTGLRADRYALMVDGERIGVFGARELARGVNLARENSTPQARQAAEVLRLVKEWHELLCRNLRILAQAEHWHLTDVPRTATEDEVRSALKKELKRIHGSSAELDNYNRGIMERYLTVKPQEAETRACLGYFLEEIRRQVQPKTRYYELRPLSAA